jgi:hypothetical protein
MRYLVGLVWVLAALVVSPLSVSAQDGEESTTVEPSAEEPAPEEPALQLKLDAAGVEVTPSPSRTEDGYTLEETELRVKRAKMGLLAPAALIVAGVPLLVRGRTSDCAYDAYWSFVESERCRRLRTSGMALTVSGGVGMIVGSILVGVRKRDLSWIDNGYTLEEMERRVRNAKIGVGVSAVPILIGFALVWGALAGGVIQYPPPSREEAVRDDRLGIAGGILVTGG